MGSSNKASGSRPKRRWLNIGPGMVLALAISALIGSQWIKAELAARQQKNAPPIVEQQGVSFAHEGKAGPTPEVVFIIDRAAKFHLTAGQLVRLRALQSEWERTYGPKMAAAAQAATEADKYLADAKGKPRTPVARLQSAAAPVIAMSGEISAARRRSWERAVAVLMPDQIKMVNTEREAAWANRKTPRP